jgi:hypothetical protein
MRRSATQPGWELASLELKSAGPLLMISVALTLVFRASSSFNLQALILQYKGPMATLAQ